MLEAVILLAGLLIAGVIGTRISQLTHLPRVVGYLLMGIAAHYLIDWIGNCFAPLQDVPRDLARQASVEVLSLGLCLILFSIGLEFDGRLIRHLRGHIWKLTLTETAVIIVLVFLGCWTAVGFKSIVAPVFLAIGAVATAPGATLLVLRQYEAKGPLTNHVLAMTGMNNLVSIVLFYVTFFIFAKVGWIHAESMEHGLVWGLLLATVVSALVGFLLGLCLSIIHAMLTRNEVILAFFAVLMAVSACAKPLGLNSLILCMFMGIAFTNFTIQPHAFRRDVAFLTTPLLVLFFVLAGFKLDLSQLGHVGWIGFAYVVMRIVGKIGGAKMGVRWIGPRYQVPENIGIGLLCQAGVIIGLGKFLSEHWGRMVDGEWVPHEDAYLIDTVILASVAIYELAGPIFTKRAAVQAGEVKAISLLERRSGGVHEVATVLGRLRRFLAFGGANSKATEKKTYTTRDLMRTNVETLEQMARMVDVLHFVERSRLNQFYVLDAERCFVGRVNFGDLRHLMFNPMLASVVNAFDMANTSAPVAVVDQPLEEILDLFHRHNVDSLPVVDNPEHRRFLGVIEQRDVLRALHVDESGESVDVGH